MSKIFTFYNHKGGVGKTTLVYNLAWNLALRDKKVLVIDLDSQMNLTSELLGYVTNDPLEFGEIQRTHSNIKKILESVFSATPYNETPYSQPHDKKSMYVDIILGSSDIYEQEYTLTMNLMCGFPFPIGHLLKTLKTYSANYDFTLIDCSPSALSFLNAFAALYCDYLVLPIAPNHFCSQALKNVPSIFDKWFSVFSKYSDLIGEPTMSFWGSVLNMCPKYSEEQDKWINTFNQDIEVFKKRLTARRVKMNERNIIGIPDFYEIQERLYGFYPYLKLYNELACAMIEST